MNQTSQQRKLVWVDHFQAQRESGLSQMAYCAQHAVKPHRFWYWKRKLEGGANPKPKGQPNPDKDRFVPVNITTPASTQGLSITLANGITFGGIDEHNHLLAQQLIGVLK